MKIKFTKFIAFAFLSLSTCLNAFPQAPSDLFISEYVEGSSNNKALEFYNGTNAAIDLSTGNYVVQMYFNGALTVGTTIHLAGIIAANSTFVLQYWALLTKRMAPVGIMAMTLLC
jgi:predicted extracellular nuclease